jgi:hypothetical protein
MGGHGEGEMKGQAICARIGVLLLAVTWAMCYNTRCD